MTAPALRVLFVQFTAKPSGSPVSGLMLARGMVERGWRVDVALGEDGAMRPEFEALGGTITFIPHGQWLKGGSALHRLRRLFREVPPYFAFARLLRTARPDLVYINTSMGLAAALAARRRDIPIVWHLRELIPERGGEAFPPFGGRGVARRAIAGLSDRVISISPAVQNSFLGDDVPAHACVIPNAVSDALFSDAMTVAEARAQFALPADVPIVGVPGTLRDVKGQDVVLDAVPRLLERVPGVIIAITGAVDGPFAQTIAARARAIAPEGTVRMLGNVTRMDAFYRAIDVACIPSRSEPFGRTVIEAFAAGRPVVASRVGGIATTVRDQENGLLVPPGDAAALADGLARALTDAPLRDSIARRAREDARSEYSEATYRARVLDIVDKALARRTA